jgi:hypothetical protein
MIKIEWCGESRSSKGKAYDDFSGTERERERERVGGVEH